MNFENSRKQNNFSGMTQADVDEFLRAFPERKKDAERVASLAQELNDLMQEEGLNIPTLVSIVDCLRVGKIDDAIRMYGIDGDKLHSYPKIEEVILKKLIS